MKSVRHAVIVWLANEGVLHVSSPATGIVRLTPATMYADTSIFFYQLPRKLLGGDYGVGLSVPYVWMDVTASWHEGRHARVLEVGGRGERLQPLGRAHQGLPRQAGRADQSGGRGARAASMTTAPRRLLGESMQPTQEPPP